MSNPSADVAENSLKNMLIGQQPALHPGIQDPAKPFTFTGRVTYASETAAAMVKKALDVDPELRPDAVTRQLNLEGSTLVLNFAAIDMRMLRSAVGTFCDLLGLATRTLEAFGAPADTGQRPTEA